MFLILQYSILDPSVSRTQAMTKVFVATPVLGQVVGLLLWSLSSFCCCCAHEDGLHVRNLRSAHMYFHKLFFIDQFVFLRDAAKKHESGRSRANAFTTFM